MESEGVAFIIIFLTDIGVFWGTLWHVHAMVFNMSSNLFQPGFYFYPAFLNISQATGRAGGTDGRAGGRYGRSLRALARGQVA